MGVVGGVCGGVVSIALPWLIRKNPEDMVYYVIGILAFFVVFLVIWALVFLITGESVRKLVAIILLLPILVLIFSGIMLYSNIAPPDAPYLAEVKNIANGKYFQNWPSIVRIFMFLVMAPLLIYFFRFLYANVFTREKILKNGLAAKAKILKIVDNSIYVNGQPVFKITLEVTSPSQGVYEVTKDFLVPHMDLALMQPGTIVNVKIDPNNPKNVVFDTWTGNVE